ncbi:MAG: hypothetical protein U0746_08165 [Gemmataceae bacterium]
MGDIFYRLSGAQVIGFSTIFGVFLWGTFLIALRFYAHAQQTRRAELDAALKQEMLSRGMSAEEIRMVCDAGSEYTVRSNRRACRV